jgi:CheY-like chemotaxis protein
MRLRRAESPRDVYEEVQPSEAQISPFGYILPKTEKVTSDRMNDLSG